MPYSLLDTIRTPEELRALDRKQLPLLAEQLRAFLLETVSTTIYYKPLRHRDTVGGHLPGDAVEVDTCGFSFEGRVLIRAGTPSEQIADGIHAQRQPGSVAPVAEQFSTAFIFSAQRQAATAAAGRGAGRR